MKKIRIFIVEDHPIFREALMTLLRRDQALDIIGSDGDAQQAILRINELQPDIVITDLSMPRVSGQQLIETIRRHHPDIKTIVLTMHNSETHVRSSLDAGANAYVLKDDTHKDLTVAIHSVYKNGSYLSPGICSNIIGGYLNLAKPSTVITDQTKLTNRERQILKLIAEGKSNRNMATILSISSKTVEKHRSNIMKKLDLHNAAHLTKYAIENNYI